MKRADRVSGIPITCRLESANGNVWEFVRLEVQAFLGTLNGVRGCSNGRGFQR
jgi:hypothetical protein